MLWQYGMVSLHPGARWCMMLSCTREALLAGGFAASYRAISRAGSWGATNDRSQKKYENHIKSYKKHIKSYENHIKSYKTIGPRHDQVCDIIAHLSHKNEAQDLEINNFWVAIYPRSLKIFEACDQRFTWFSNHFTWFFMRFHIVLT